MLGLWFGLTTFKVFSTINDPKILYFYGLIYYSSEA